MRLVDALSLMNPPFANSFLNTIIYDGELDLSSECACTLKETRPDYRRWKSVARSFRQPPACDMRDTTACLPPAPASSTSHPAYPTAFASSAMLMLQIICHRLWMYSLPCTRPLEVSDGPGHYCSFCVRPLDHLTDTINIAPMKGSIILARHGPQ